MSLNAIKVLNLKPKERDYRVADSGGLYVLVWPNGSKLWRYDYRLGDARRTFSIGAYSDAGDGVDHFTLRQAGDEHEKAREAVKAGQHPRSARRSARRWARPRRSPKLMDHDLPVLRCRLQRGHGKASREEAPGHHR